MLKSIGTILTFAAVSFFFAATTMAQSPVIELFSNEPLLIRFPYTPAGQSSAPVSVRFRTSNISTAVIVTAPIGFELSKTNQVFTNELTYTIPELSSSGNTIFIRFKPQENNKGYGGSLLMRSSGTELQRPDLSASSLPQDLSLDVVTWNISWLGSEFNGPFNDLLQAQYAARVMDSLKADIYLLQEIVDTSLLGYISRNISNGPYDYAVSLYASNALNTLSGNWRIGQKMAYLYKRNLFSNVSARGFTANSSNPNNFYYWASGRYPFRMDATVNVAGKTKRVGFINLHAKAELGEPTDYFRRKGGADIMYDSLTINHADEYFMIGGDFNDDLDVTISQVVQETLTPYYSFMSDDFRFTPVSYWNSQRGDNSYIGYPNVVDHVILSHQMGRDYVPFSCIIRKDVAEWIPNYRNDLSDHYPVESRYDLQQSPSNLITGISQTPTLKEAIQIVNNPSVNPVILFHTSVTGSAAIRVMTADGKTLYMNKYQHIARNTRIDIPLQHLPAGCYFLIITTPQGQFSEKLIR
jgi:hypothetical protein